MHGVARAPSTLAKLAVTGDGPEFQRVHRVPYYSRESLDVWVASKLSPPVRSTSDTAPANSNGGYDRMQPQMKTAQVTDRTDN